MIRIHILDCGSTFVDEALPLSDRSKNPLAFTGIGRGKKYQREVPVTAYLIEHPDALILVDTGWDTAIRKDARRYEGFFNYFASPGVLPPGKAVTEHLAELGYRPADIRYCILTHMDIDHAGGIGLVRDAQEILASEAELKAAARPDPRYLKRLWKDIPITPFPNVEYDLLGDGSVVLEPFPGHSAGMTGVKVTGENGYCVLAGDCGYARESWEKLILPGITWNRQMALASLMRLQICGRDPACRAILMTHDPEHRSGLLEL
jgi:glyoxylase-like metal-dependent hydrolase (beta-lactamase superfamily II)